MKSWAYQLTAGLSSNWLWTEMKEPTSLGMTCGRQVEPPPPITAGFLNQNYSKKSVVKQIPYRFATPGVEPKTAYYEA